MAGPEPICRLELCRFLGIGLGVRLDRFVRSLRVGFDRCLRAGLAARFPCALLPGGLQPPRRQIRWTRLALTSQPSALSSAVIRR